MRPQAVTVSAVGTSEPRRVNYLERNFKLGLGVALSAGATLTYSVEHTFDDPANFTDATDYNTNGTWYETSGLNGLTQSEDGNIVVPVQAVRLNVTVHTGGSATLTILQAT